MNDGMTTLYLDYESLMCLIDVVDVADTVVMAMEREEGDEINELDDVVKVVYELLSVDREERRRTSKWHEAMKELLDT